MAWTRLASIPASQCTKRGSEALDPDARTRPPSARGKTTILAGPPELFWHLWLGLWARLAKCRVTAVDHQTLPGKAEKGIVTTFSYMLPSYVTLLR